MTAKTKKKASSKNETSDTEEGTRSQTPSLPQFFKKPVALNKTTHSKAGLKKNTGFGFARNTITIPVTIMEVVEASRQYPIVFINDSLVAVTGLRERNLFIDDNNQWSPESYIPLGARKYPFTFVNLEEGKMALCIDEAAEHYASSAPDLPFFENGEDLSEVSKQAMEMCKGYRGQMMLTNQFCKEISADKLLEPKVANLVSSKGEEINLDGFYTLNEAAWMNSPDLTYKKYKEKNWLGMLFLIMASQVNWKYLALKA